VIATLPGDLIFCHGSAWLPRAIRWATRSKGEGATWANHVAGITSPGMALEASWTVIEHPLPELAPPYQIWRYEPLTDAQREAVAVAALAYKGRSYGGAKLLTHLGDALLSKVFGGNPLFFRRLNHREEYPICSWLWAFAYERALSYQFGIPPEAASPDDMHDHVCITPGWFMVGAEA
jgi:hypothetical protein